MPLYYKLAKVNEEIISAVGNIIQGNLYDEDLQRRAIWDAVLLKISKKNIISQNIINATYSNRILVKGLLEFSEFQEEDFVKISNDYTQLCSFIMDNKLFLDICSTGQKDYYSFTINIYKINVQLENYKIQSAEYSLLNSINGYSSKII